MKIRVRHLVIFVAAAAIIGGLPASACAKTAPVNLGASASYGVFSQHVISNTGTTTVLGDVGVAPGGHPFPTGLVVSGKMTNDDAGPLAALRAAFADAMSRPFDQTITGDLGGVTLPPGVYRGQSGSVEEDSTVGPASFTISGTLTLDAKGDPDAVWIFQAADDLWLGRGGRIELVNGARFCRVFWAVDRAWLSPDSSLQGHVLATGDVNAGTGASVRGQLMSSGDTSQARDGFVALNANRIDNSAYACPTATATPRLPKTGYPPRREILPWQVLVAALVGAAVVLSALRRRAPASR